MGKNTRSVMFQTDYGQFILAVNPPELTIENSSSEKSIELLNVGQIVLPANRGPQKITVSTFLPSPTSPFYKGNVPEEITGMIRKSKNGKKSLRIIVSGTDINAKFFVSAEKVTYKEGQQDAVVSWSFIEDRHENIIAVAVQSKGQTDTGLLERAGNISVPKEVMIKKGDTLWALAARYYQDGTQWKKIARANGIENERMLQLGSRIVIPE